MEDADFISSKAVLGDVEEKGKFRVIVESAPVGIGEIGLEPPRFKWINEATCRILGYTEEELLSINPHDLIAKESKPLFRKRMKKIINCSF